MKDKIKVKINILFNVLRNALLFNSQVNNESINRILIIATLRMGDLIMCSSLFYHLKKNFPNAELTALIRSELIELGQYIPYIDRFILFKEKNLELIDKLKRGKYDLSINVCEGKLNSIVYAAGIPRRIGYIQKNKLRDKYFLTDKVSWEGEFIGLPAFFLRLLEPLGIYARDLSPLLNIPVIEYDYYSKFFQTKKGLKILIHPGGRNPTRRWPYYNLLINKIAKKFDCQIIIVGSKEESIYINEVIEKKQPINLYNFCGKTSLSEVIALCKIADIAIGNDSGILHIARAVKTPTITIFGPEDYRIIGNSSDKDIKIFLDLECKKDSDYFGIKIKGVKRCKKYLCKDHICMRGISEDIVLENLEKLILKEFSV